MTKDNLTFSIEIDFVPDAQKDREAFLILMKEAAGRHHGSYTLDKDKRPVIGGLSGSDTEASLSEIGLSAFGTWPPCILTCTIAVPLPIRAVGMSDGWDIYTGPRTFFAFAQFPSDVIRILTRACTYYLDRESFQTFKEFIDQMGFEAFRDAVLENTVPSDGSADAQIQENGNSAYWGGGHAGPALTAGNFIRPEHNIMEILNAYPEMGPLLMEYGMSCVGCFISYDENLWQACQAHGLDVFEVLGEMNEYIADKFHTSFLTAETPMQDIMTLYPQLIPIFRDAGAEFPDDMTTPIGQVCAASKTDTNALLEKCHKKLRQEI